MTKLVTIKTFNNAFQANFEQSKLEANGIDCCLFDEHMIGLNPLYNIALGGIKLKVRPEDVNLALEILAENDNSEN